MENETQTIPDDTRTPKADKEEEGEIKENDNVSTEPKNALLEEEEGDCCSICLDELPIRISQKLCVGHVAGMECTIIVSKT